MEYKVIALNKNGTIDTIIESISEEEYAVIRNNIHKLQTFMLSKDYYYIVKENIQDLLNFMKKFNPMDNKNKEHNFATINRYTYNVIGVFYAWISYYEKNYKDVFSKIKKKYYDSFFEYRMMYNLRTYMSHCEMAVTEMEVLFDTRELFIYIEPTRLLNNSDHLQKIFIPELKKMIEDNKKIDLYELMTKFSTMFSEMNQGLLNEIHPEIQKIIKGVCAHIRFEGETAQQCIIVDKETDKNVLYLTSFMGMFEHKMFNPY
jgi:hypothetical protein